MIKFSDYTNLIIEQFKLCDFVSLNQYLSNPREVNRKLSSEKGVYFVIYPYEWRNDLFVKSGTGGHFKGKDPNVSIEELRKNWVEGADILYIGKAGGITVKGFISEATLKKRITALLRFGNNSKVGHWGGRYLWQHKNSADFRVYWYPCSDDENPVELERQLINEFERIYKKIPFANLR